MILGVTQVVLFIVQGLSFQSKKESQKAQWSPHRLSNPSFSNFIESGFIRTSVLQLSSTTAVNQDREFTFSIRRFQPAFVRSRHTHGTPSYSLFFDTTVRTAERDEEIIQKLEHISKQAGHWWVSNSHETDPLSLIDFDERSPWHGQQEHCRLYY